MKTLKLFNAVVAKESGNSAPFISEEGFIIEPAALWAKDRIIAYYQHETLNGNALNKTFHKSWAKIKNSSRYELFVEQVTHYMSTYGSDFQDEVYIPNEVLDLPDVKITYKVVRAYSTDEMTKKCLSLLKSGIALTEETVDDIISVLTDELNYTFTGKEGIRNKEAIVKIAESHGVFPNDPTEFLRYVIYRTTDTTLLIKNPMLIHAIKDSSYNPSVDFKKFGLERLAEIFNRFKPLFLAYKTRCPKTINKISKLSKKHHKPLVSNPLNEVTHRLLMPEDAHWLDNATVYALFKALSATYTRMNGQDAFLYRIRNGKSWAAQNIAPQELTNAANHEFILQYMVKRCSLEGTKIFIPKNVKYALPTSEKMFVGNIPTGTRFYGKKLAVGIYWENSWGANDLDLSGLNIGGKVGWNSQYNYDEGSLMYSGDLTDASNGAVEYLYANKGLNEPTLVMNSVYSGDPECGYKIIVGKGDKISHDYMMNPENLFMETTCKSVQQTSILGIIIPKKDKQCFVLLNFGAGNARVSGNSETTNIATKALYQQWSKPLSFNKIAKLLGAELVEQKEAATIDLSLDNLEKDSFVKLLTDAEKAVEEEVSY
jgi:hypothetical protein